MRDLDFCSGVEHSELAAWCSRDSTILYCAVSGQQGLGEGLHSYQEHFVLAEKKGDKTNQKSLTMEKEKCDDI